MAKVIGRVPYEVLSPADLEALPLGTVRDWKLGHVYVKMERREDGWAVIKRRGVPSRALVGCPSAPYDAAFAAPEPEPEQAPGWQKVGPALFTNKPSTPTDDSLLAAMERIRDRMPID